MSAATSGDASSPAVAPLSVRLRPTPAGRGVAVFVGAALLVSWGAGGLLAVYASAGVALLAVAPLLAWLHGRALRLESPGAVTAFAGEAFPLDVGVVDRSRVLAARDVVLLHRTGRTDAERPAGYAATVRPGSRVVVPTIHRLGRRGRHDELSMAVETQFPLGLAVCRLEFRLPVDLLVLPRLGTVRNLDALTARRHGLLFQGASDRGDEQEFHGLREWREGESVRRVHWKLSARRGRLLVREFRGEDRPPVHIVLDTRVPPRRRARSARGGSFETAVSLAATLVEHHLRRRHLVRFSALGSRPYGVERRRGRDALFPILAALAEVHSEQLAERRSFDVATRKDEVVFLVCAGASRRIPGLPADAVVLDVEQRDTLRIFHRARPSSASPLFGRSR